MSVKLVIMQSILRYTLTHEITLATQHSLFS
ncbi:hypothetical protein F945_03689 [Acinetobacter rudis CIP 110305]|uniref:Uncharacterized protein n=1 Tax=Acinetobacter rudis CIP 110305 TaxID=421052 RepID=S3MSB9_9GAMM|nr:hypothetical protein F945_03689 [Acinetobacter rudis CIP 110305]